jgi:sugar O-acyltransferase (sialic acid O-acetyltransferase NeuD family)
MIHTGVLVIGAGGHGAEVCSYVDDLRGRRVAVELLGVIDDARRVGAWRGGRVLGSIAELPGVIESFGGAPVEYITALGNNAAREDVVRRIEELGIAGLRPWTLRHPSAQVGARSMIGEGTLLGPGVIVTADVSIGRHCVLNVKVSVSHDAVVGDFVNLNPGCTLAGNVTVGRGAFIGAGATVIQGISIGEGAIVGAGSVVIRDVPPHVTAVGVPAQVIKYNLRRADD